MYKIILLCLTCLVYGQSYSVNISDSTVKFNNTYSSEMSKFKVVLTNKKNKPEVVKILLLDTIRFDVSAKTITLAANGSDSLIIYFYPIHNLFYHTEVVLQSSLTPNIETHIHISGQGKYKETYYAATENKSEQELKNILQGIITKNHTALGYNKARDYMFMEIDNWKTNGKGASTNTLECVYTGRQITGYTSRSNAQNTPNDFNTEHTWPQSLFNSSDPMVSDLNHLFPTDNTANNVRSNDPFGLVGNPSWQVGGSRAVNGTFEPRDEQKGRTARAMLYFVIRYQNYSNYLNGQEKILKTWHHQFGPTQSDSIRNEDIYKYQKNRNPFIDHPELVDRITNFSDSSYAANDSSLFVTSNELNFELTDFDTLQKFNIYAYNKGNLSLILGNFQSKNSFLTIDNSSGLVQAGYVAGISGSVKFNSAQKVYTDTIWFTYGGKSQYIIYQVNGNVGVGNQPITNKVYHVYPNPANGLVTIDEDFKTIELIQLDGKPIHNVNMWGYQPNRIVMVIIVFLISNQAHIL
ncbi:MAG: endonuclease [Bacteroidetes bacterium]|nr:endonuclease [Bacteroidota bacterium]